MMPGTTSSITVRLALWLACSIAFLSACTDPGSSNAPTILNSAAQSTNTDGATDTTAAPVTQKSNPGEKQLDEQDVVAIINEREITTSQLDAHLRIQLHELDLARYELRSRRLKRLIVEQVLAPEAANNEGAVEAALAKADVKILLEPPLPPRFKVEKGDNEVRGNPGAPVTIIEFLDFQSPHSMRVQPVLHRILEDYGPLVRLIARDLPLHFHHQAQQAAEAAECARAQGVYWRYHDLLLQNQDNLTPSSLIHYASTLDLEIKQFQACLNTEQAATAVKEDVIAARKLGLHSTPTFFINGLYLRGPRKYHDFARLINRELERLGFLNEAVVRNLSMDQSPFRSARLSTLPFTLIGTAVKEDPTHSIAVIHNNATESTQSLKPGDKLLEDVELVLVVQRRAYLQHGDQLEYLPLSGLPGEITPSEESAQPTPVPDVVVTLRRTEINKALRDSDKLEKALTTGSMDLEGKRLLKLTEVEPRGLYDMLGLRAKDVLMQVDGQWVHDQQNPLWNALRTRDTVTLVIMRKGFPKTFQYVIEEDRK